MLRQSAGKSLLSLNRMPTYKFPSCQCNHWDEVVNYRTHNASNHRATIVKAFFDDTFVLSQITDIVQASEDGLSLVPYIGSDAGRITVGGEMNKIAANIAIGRNHAAVHWRSDYADSLPLGEAVAISVLRDQRATYNEQFSGFTFTKFDGTKITV